MNEISLPPIKARFSINVLENLDNEILLLKRSTQSKFGSGLWGFPAGHIEETESPNECALRELREEIGESFSLETINEFGPVRDSFYGGVYQIYLYHFLWLGGDIRLNHEHTDSVWANRNDFKHYNVMDGIDEDIHYLNIWPVEYLNQNKLPHITTKNIATPDYPG